MDSWQVVFTKKSAKQVAAVPEAIRLLLNVLRRDIEISGPVRGEWPNYSKLGPTRHHCHLKKRGRPTYVACWEVVDRTVRIVEFYYVGTRERAPY